MLGTVVGAEGSVAEKASRGPFGQCMDEGPSDRFGALTKWGQGVGRRDEAYFDILPWEEPGGTACGGRHRVERHKAHR